MGHFCVSPLPGVWSHVGHGFVRKCLQAQVGREVSILEESKSRTVGVSSAPMNPKEKWKPVWGKTSPLHTQAHRLERELGVR